MAVCYIGGIYEKTYKCVYTLKEDHIEVSAEYNIMDEMEAKNGVRVFDDTTKFKTRDILICDYDNKKNYLLKNAFYAGYSHVYGNPDGGEYTKFQAHIFFEHGDYNQLCELPETPKIKKIKISSKTLNDLTGFLNVQTIKSEDEYTIRLPKAKIEEIGVNCNNIEKIKTIAGWNSLLSREQHSFHVEFNGYIELDLGRRSNYDSIHEYINELIIYMQLYYPDKFIIDNIWVMVDDEYYKMSTYKMKINHKETYIEKTVNEGLLEFLHKCYTLIPYRKSKQEIRNIPYIVLRQTRNLEDIFLTLYRFIECYYKRQQIKNIRKTFMSYSITNHYASKYSLTDTQIENFTQEIICLRNHFVHSGYFIKNSSLKITFDKVNQKKNPKDYTANDVDFHWIHKRTQILYEIVIDIIFSKMLGYEKYKFAKRF